VADRVPDGLADRVRQRAGNRCEYCRAQQAFQFVSFHADHIVSQFHQGLTLEENLALACPACNSRKGTNLAGVDPDTGELTPLFHPRKQSWTEHFQVIEGRVVGVTAVGRTTVWVCNMNAPKRLDARRRLIAAGLF
jgi:DNA-directed RNA polymerase subunit RPC12/RpoP